MHDDLDYDDLTDLDLEEREREDTREGLTLESAPYQPVITDAMQAELSRQLTADLDKLGNTALAIKAERDELKAVLRDIAMGADMMLEPALNVQGAMRAYILEVKRVARAAL